MRAARSRSTKGPKEIFGWIAFLDIFGFRSHLESDFFPDSEKKLLNMHELLRKNSVFNAKSNYFMFSDSIVLWSEVETADDNSLRRFVDRIAAAQQIAAQYDFLLRGSLAYGRILLSKNYILGNAYLRAYTYESANLINPIVVIPAHELEMAEVRAPFEAELQSIALKGKTSDSVMVLNFVPWDQIQRIKAANIASIRSSDSLKQDELVARWEAIKAR